MSVERLAQIRVREGAATKGPWHLERHEPTLARLVVSEDCTLDISFGYIGNRTEGDAEFVAHARDDVPDLLAEVERLRVRVAELEAGRNRINSLPPSRQTLAALRVIRRPVRRWQQDGGENCDR